MSKSSQKSKVECLKLWLTTVKIKPRKPKGENTDYKVNIKGFTK